MQATHSPIENGTLVFGFVPQHIINDLQDIGNWKSRSTAIDVLQRSFKVVSRACIVPYLPSFLAFLTTLVADPNFKVAICSMQVLGDLISKVAADVSPYLKTISSSLLEKFTDSKTLVRTTAMQVMRRLLAAVPPGDVLQVLSAGLHHPAWRVREAVVNVNVMSLLLRDASLPSTDAVGVLRVLIAAAQDAQDEVRSASLEGLALLHSRGTPGKLLDLVSAMGMPELLKRQLLLRLSKANPANSTERFMELLFDSTGAVGAAGAPPAVGSGPISALLGLDALPTFPAASPSAASPGAGTAAARAAPRFIRSSFERPLAAVLTSPGGGSGSGSRGIGSSSSDGSLHLHQQDLQQGGGNCGGGGGVGVVSHDDTPVGATSGCGLHANQGSGGSSNGSRRRSSSVLAPSGPLKSLGLNHHHGQQGRVQDHSQATNPQQQLHMPSRPEPTAGGSSSAASAGGWSPGSNPQSSFFTPATVPSILQQGRPGNISTGPSGSTGASTVAQTVNYASAPGREREHDASAAVRGRGGSGGVLSIGRPSAADKSSFVQDRPWDRNWDRDGDRDRDRRMGAAPADGDGGGDLEHYTSSVGQIGDVGPHLPQQQQQLLLEHPPNGTVAGGGGVPRRPRAGSDDDLVPLHCDSSPLMGRGRGPKDSDRDRLSNLLLEQPPPGVPLPEHQFQASQQRSTLTSSSKSELLANLKLRQIQIRAASAQISYRAHECGSGSTGISDTGTPPWASQLTSGSGASHFGALHGSSSFALTSSILSSPHQLLASYGSAPMHPLSSNAGIQDHTRMSPAGTRSSIPMGPSPGGGSSLGRGEGIPSLASPQVTPFAVAGCARPFGVAGDESGGSEGLGLTTTALSPQHLTAQGMMPLRRVGGGSHGIGLAGGDRGSGSHGAGSSRGASGSSYQERPEWSDWDDGSPTLGGGGSGGTQAHTPVVEQQQQQPPQRLGRQGLRSVTALPLPVPESFANSNSHGGSSSFGAIIFGSSGCAGTGPGDDSSTEDLSKPLAEPERHIRSVIAKLADCNASVRKELDWQGQGAAINDARRLVRHHPTIVRQHLRELVRATVPAVDELRSTTSRMALLLFAEIFGTLGRAMDREVDDLAPALLKKAGEVSNAGRENFLAVEADRVLGEMCRSVDRGRAMSVLLAGAGHKSMHVRAKVAAHIDEVLDQPGTGQALSSNTALAERTLRVAAGFLDEGSLDTRLFAKRIVWRLRHVLSAFGVDFDRMVMSLQPDALQKRVAEVLDSCGPNAPMPPLPSRTTLGSRNSGGAASSVAPPTPSWSGASSGAGGGSETPPRQRAVPNSAPGGLGFSALGASHLPSSGAAGTSAGDYSPSGSSSGVPDGSFGSSSGARSFTADGYPTTGSLAKASVAGFSSCRAQADGGGGGSLRRCASGSTAAAAALAQLDDAEAAAAAAASGAFDGTVQAALSRAIAQLTSKDFRERSEGLGTVVALSRSLAAAPDSVVVLVLEGLVGRLADNNVKVAVQALDTMALLCPVLRERMQLALNTFVPALAAAMGASSDKVRGASGPAADALLAHVPAPLLLQHLAHCVTSGTAHSQRGRAALVDKLRLVAEATWPSKQQLVIRHAIPAAVAIVNDAKVDASGRSAGASLVASLARMMGPTLLTLVGGVDSGSSPGAVARLKRFQDAVDAAMVESGRVAGSGSGGAGTGAGLGSSSGSSGGGKFGVSSGGRSANRNKF